MKEFLRDWQEHRAWQWLLRRGISPRVVQAGGVSLGAHGLLFLLIAFFPGLPFVVNVPVSQEEEVLEIAFQTSAPADPQEQATVVEEQPQQTGPEAAAPENVALPAAEKTAETAPAEAPPAPRGIVTQLDPEYLKKTTEAPKDATFIASHNAEATPGGTPDPRPRPEAPASEQAEGAIEFRSAKAAQPAESEETSIAALGAWNKAVGNAIGARWEHYRRTKVESLRPGSVRLRFSIDARGRVSDVHILSNDAGSTNALYAVRSTTEAEIPPIPADRLARLPGQGKRIEVKYTFTIWPNS